MMHLFATTLLMLLTICTNAQPKGQQSKTPSPFDDRALNTDGVYTTHQYIKD